MSDLFPRPGVLLALLVSLFAFPALTQSMLTQRPQDPAAVFLTTPHGGVEDATAALQSAINQVQSTSRRGIVFLGPGRYRISKTIQVWSGIRLIGYGATRPTLVLADKTFSSSATHHPLLHYAGERPEDNAVDAPPGNAGTFYSGLINVDIDLGFGNPGANGISFHVAQHGVLSHVRINATGAFAAIEAAASTMTNLEIIGGEYGINTHQTAASWPYLLMDSTLTGQRRASIHNSEATGTFIRDTFSSAPSVLLIDPAHPGQIYLADSSIHQITGVAFRLPSSAQPFAFAARHIRCAESQTITPAITFQFPEDNEVDELLVGVRVDPDGRSLPTSETHKVHHGYDHSTRALASDIPQLPSDQSWRNLRDFGALGDDHADDTLALRRAIDSGNPIYLPQGRYRITAPVILRSSTILIGLNPITTQITIADNTPAFASRTLKPKAMLIAPTGSHPILSGIGLSAGGINPAASGLLWQARGGLVDDVRFLGGHGTALPDGRYRQPYNADRTADFDPGRAWDSQPPSLLIDGGGGTFRNIWTPNTYAAAGLAGQDTSIPSNLYLISAEHHVRNEVVLERVQNWSFFGLQTESEKTEGSHGIPLTIRSSANLTFINSVFYRVSRTLNPAPVAVSVGSSRNIMFVNVDNRSQSPFPFESTIATPTSKVDEHFFNVWTSAK